MATNIERSNSDKLIVSPTCLVKVEEGDTANDKDQAATGRDWLLHNSPLSLEEVYEISPEPLGRGNYACVFLGVNRHSGAIRAVKRLDLKNSKNHPMLWSEAEALKQLDHPNIVKLFETYMDDEYLYLVLELCTGGELYDRVMSEHFCEAFSAAVMRQVLQALHYLEKKCIMHRDIKPENFLFLDDSNPPVLKIIDFGLARQYQPGQVFHSCAGTPYYVAPEVLRGEYNHKSDLWSAGVLLYFLLYGYPPFIGDTDTEILRAVNRGTFSFPDDGEQRISSGARDLIKRLLTLNISERLSAHEALHHPWIRIAMGELVRYINPTLSYQIVNCFRGFSSLSKFKKAAITLIARQISEDHLSDIRQIFLEIDIDNDGTITPNEVRKCLTETGWSNLPTDLDSLFDAVDSDGSGRIEYTEFVAACLEEQCYTERQLCYHAFCIFDQNLDGKISLDEILRVLIPPNKKSVYSTAHVNSAKEIIESADKDGDGQIDFDEFLEMMKE